MNESYKFVLLKDVDDAHCTKKHKCTVFGPFQSGTIENIGKEALFRLDLSMVEDFVGRRKEQQYVIS